MNDKVIDFTIGADPEFFCLGKNNKIIQAYEWVNDADDGEFGADGCGTTFEIRPAPSKEPLKVVNNIHEIFVRKTIESPDILKFKWYAGSYKSGYPLGGHVHFGLTDNIINHTNAVNFLDNYVGVTSLLLEVKEDGLKRRAGRNYGYIGDYRQQEWGFEYRAMSSWLTSPYVAAAILCLSKTVMYEAVNNPDFKWHEFACADDFFRMNQKRILSKFSEIWADITKMELYQTYKPYIDLIYFLISKKLSWISASGMKESWGVVDMQPVISSKIGLDVIWARYNNEQIA